MSSGKWLESAVENYLRYKNVMYIRIENYRCFRCGQVQNAKALHYSHLIPRRNGNGQSRALRNTVIYLVRNNIGMYLWKNLKFQFCLQA